MGEESSQDQHKRAHHLLELERNLHALLDNPRLPLRDQALVMSAIETIEGEKNETTSCTRT